MPTCPAEGCDFSGSKNQVVGHYSGSEDSKHKGGYQDVTAQLKTEKPEKTDSKSMDNNLEFPSAPDNQETESIDECPKCGNENWYATEELLGEGAYSTKDEKEVLRSHDRVCVNCGEAYNE